MDIYDNCEFGTARTVGNISIQNNTLYPKEAVSPKLSSKNEVTSARLSRSTERATFSCSIRATWEWAPQFPGGNTIRRQMRCHLAYRLRQGRACGWRSKARG